MKTNRGLHEITQKCGVIPKFLASSLIYTETFGMERFQFTNYFIRLLAKVFCKPIALIPQRYQKSLFGLLQEAYRKFQQGQYFCDKDISLPKEKILCFNFLPK